MSAAKLIRDCWDPLVARMDANVLIALLIVEMAAAALLLALKVVPTATVVANEDKVAWETEMVPVVAPLSDV